MVLGRWWRGKEFDNTRVLIFGNVVEKREALGGFLCGRFEVNEKEMIVVWIVLMRCFEIEIS